MNRKALTALFATLAVGGCTLAPDYQQPESPVPATAGDNQRIAEELVLPGWEALFQDPQLQQLIRTALSNNRDLRLALLDVADDLLSAVEAALGLTLDPFDIGPCPDTAGLTVRIGSLDQQIVLLLSVPFDAAILAQPAPLAPSLLGHIALPVAIAVAGPRLSPADAATLAPGDLLLIGPAPIAATLRPPHGDAVPGRLDPVARCFRPH